MTEIELSYQESIVLTLPNGDKIRICHGGHDKQRGAAKIAIVAPRHIEILRPDARNHNARNRKP